MAGTDVSVRKGAQDMSESNAPWTSLQGQGIQAEFQVREVQDDPIIWEPRRFSPLKDFGNFEVYRAAFIEFITSGIYVFLSLATVITALQSHFESNLAAIAFIHVLLIAFFISSALPASGGHFNPILTFTSFLTGHSSFPRAVLYIICQFAGSILGALAIKSVLHHDVAREFSLGGCLLRQDIAVDGGTGTTLSGVTDQQGFIAELIFSFIYLHINYAMGLDPKQAPVYGPILGPAFCGCLVGMTIFISGNLQPGYGGAGFNPARCLGPAVALGGVMPYLRQQYWVFIVAPACACVLEAVVYHLVPFDHSTLYKKKDSSIHVALRVLQRVESLSVSKRGRGSRHSTNDGTNDGTNHLVG